MKNNSCISTNVVMNTTNDVKVRTNVIFGGKISTSVECDVDNTTAIVEFAEFTKLHAIGEVNDALVSERNKVQLQFNDTRSIDVVINALKHAKSMIKQMEMLNQWQQMLNEEEK